MQRIRTTSLVLVALSSVGISSATAPALASDVPKISVSTQIVAAELGGDTMDYPSTKITWGNVCTDMLESGEYDCEVSFTVKHRGKTVERGHYLGSYEYSFGDSATDQEYTDDLESPQTSIVYSRDWSSCKRSGLYRWTIKASGDFVTGHDESYNNIVQEDVVRTRSGSFRIPKCRKQKPRRVSASTAAEYLNEQANDTYAGEFISQVRCGSGSRSTFHCRVQRNNNYRECYETAQIRFTKTDKFGRKKNGYTYKWGKDNCRSF